jgi:superfamily II DNA or RNA helicase
MLEIGLYEKLVNFCLRNEINKNNELDSYEKDIETGELSPVLSAYIGEKVKSMLENMEDRHIPVSDRLNFINHLLYEINNGMGDNCDNIESPPKMLLSLNSKNSVNKKDKLRPETSLAHSSIFTGSTLDPKLYSELKKEILASDSIDMLVSFIKWSGLRLIINELKEFTGNGGKLRVITTTYTGATDLKAVMELARLKNAEVKISYDTKNTRLHAKTYVFSRNTGYSTAYIGSSNLSNAAISGGLEWNLKITRVDMPDIFDRIDATFNSYWNSETFELFSPDNADKLRKALDNEKSSNREDLNYFFDIHPYYYQSEILEELKADRELRGNFRNLVVSATGTGKTIISAFDYARFVREHPGRPNRLLFIAHRDEILKQSLACFRSVLKDYNFGELYVGNHVPSSVDYVFMSIQTFESVRPDINLKRDYYDFIIIDEFHHAAAKSYGNLLSYFNPQVMLGLTATPERMDGKDILKYFNGHITSEIRLPEAIDRGILCPFQYFGITDSVNIDNIAWKRGSYDIAELENLYVNNGKEAMERARLIVDAVGKYTADINNIKALGFCVSIAHANFMSHYFNELGIPAIALTGNSHHEERDNARKKLVSGEIKVIFTVDLYNEGVDIPEINTVLFLRPTESLTVFIQQLGRGLRLSEGKDCLTVLDFIGKANRNYNFTEKYVSLLKGSHIDPANEIAKGFTHLPRDCYIELEQKAQEYILENIKKSFQSLSGLVAKIHDFISNSGIQLTLQNFLEYYHIKPQTIYSKNNFSRLCVEAGVIGNFNESIEKTMTSAFRRICQINSYSWLSFIESILTQQSIMWSQLSEAERRMLNMFFLTIYNQPPEKIGFANSLEAILEIKNYPVLFNELKDILVYLLSRINFIESPENLGGDIPLRLHSEYSRNQILGALDILDPSSMREGVKYHKEMNIDILFVTIHKSEKSYSPTTMYQDYAINGNEFHWQTQSTVSSQSPTAKRYFDESDTEHKILLFTREYKENNLGASPYVFLGAVHHLRHTGSNPVSIIWKLDDPIPPQYIEKLNGMLPA